MNSVLTYFREASETFGRCWNEFWFVPRDTNVLSLLRLLTGFVALYWLLTFTPDLITFFGPQGMIPPDLLATWIGSRSMMSYFNFFSSPAELWTVHVIGIVIVGLFTGGAFTRVTSVLALLVVLSYIHRAPMVAGEFEPILTFVMFYLCFAPCGEYLSVDALLRRRRENSAQAGMPTPGTLVHRSSATTIATRLIQVHLVLVYLMIVLGQLNGGAWWNGQAVWALMARPESRTVDLTTWLHAHPYMLNAWTHGIVLFELAFVVFIWNRWARPVLLGLSVVVWTSLALITGLHLYCAMMVLAGLAFVDPAWLRGTCPWMVFRSRPMPSAATA